MKLIAVLTLIVSSTLLAQEPHSELLAARGLKQIISAQPGALIHNLATGNLVEIQGISLPEGPPHLRFQGTKLTANAEVTPRGFRFRVPPLSSGVTNLLDSNGQILVRLEILLARFWCNRVPDRSNHTDLEFFSMVKLPAAMSALVAEARISLDAAISDFDDPEFVTALIAAHNRGVRVRLHTDRRTHHAEAAARERLTRAGIMWTVDAQPDDKNGKQVGMMHHKFLVVDKQVVWTGHAKPQINNEMANQSALSIHNSALAAAYTQEFNVLWGSSEAKPDPSQAVSGSNKPRRSPTRIQVGETSLECWFMPCTTEGNGGTYQRLIRLIQSAESEVAFLASGIGKDMVNSLDALASRGVRIRGVAGRPDWRDTFLPRLALVQEDQVEKRDVRIGMPAAWSAPAHDAHVHNRILVVDQTHIAISSTAWYRETENDENLLIIRSPTLASSFLAHIRASLQRSGYQWDDNPLEIQAEPQDDKLYFQAIDIARIFGRQIDRSDQKLTFNVGGWSLHWNQNRLSTPGPPTPEARQASVQPSALLSCQDLMKLGISIGQKSGRVILQSAEGHFAEVKNLPDQIPFADLLNQPAGLIVGPYEEILHLPDGVVARASARSLGAYRTNSLGLPALTQAGLGRLPARWSRFAAPFWPSRAGSKRAREFLLHESGPHYASLELLAAAVWARRIFKDEFHHEVKIGELSCPLGGFPDYSRNGLTDSSVDFLFGESVRLFPDKPIGAARYLSIVAHLAQRFAAISAATASIADRKEIETVFSNLKDWHQVRATSTRLQYYHDRSSTSLIFESRLTSGISLRLRMK